MIGFRVVVSLSALILVLAACGSSGSKPTTSGSTSTEVFSTPTVEGSGPESPQQPQNGGPVITDASLPIGGNTETGADPTQQCPSLAILASPPTGVTLHVTGVNFDPEGVFELGGSACSGDVTVCSFPSDVTAQSSSSCSVSVRQVPGASGHTSVTLRADVHCATQQICDHYQSTLDSTPNQQGLDSTQSDGGTGDSGPPSITDDGGSTPVTGSPAPSGT